MRPAFAAFRADPALAEAMKEAGVISVTEVDILTEMDARTFWSGLRR